MICLGIESTAHTFGAGIANGQKQVLANVISQHITEKGGIVPGAAAEHHAEVSGSVVQQALDEAGLRMKDIDAVAFAQGPGLGQCLRIGAAAARTLAIVNRKPLVGVNHCIAHLEIGKAVTPAKDPVLLYVSGANTQVISFEAGRYRVMGETLDIGVGNFLDVFARHIGIGFPGGPTIEAMAKGKRQYIPLPYVVKGMDTSFGGILTNVKNKFSSGRYSVEDLCFSIQETVFAMLVEVAERALAHTGKGELLLGGGVACNSRLQEMCRLMCRDRGAKLFVPERKLLVDNGAMIAWLGLLTYAAGETTALSKSGIRPYWRTDEVEPAYAAAR